LGKASGKRDTCTDSTKIGFTGHGRQRCPGTKHCLCEMVLNRMKGKHVLPQQEEASNQTAELSGGGGDKQIGESEPKATLCGPTSLHLGLIKEGGGNWETLVSDRELFEEIKNLTKEGGEPRKKKVQAKERNKTARARKRWGGDKGLMISK